MLIGMKPLLVAAVLGALTTIAGTTATRAADPQTAIVAATKQYVARTSATGKVQVKVEKIARDYARVKVTPVNRDETDPAWVFLRKASGGWRGVMLGTAFSPDDYRRYGIPRSVWADGK
jgi:hypothetical protein